MVGRECQLDWAEWDAVSPAELAFPLAYFITAYTDARQLELLLATVFRPHNAYCIHVDSKADPEFLQTVMQMVKCYTDRHPTATIFLPGHSVPVYWGHFSIVEAELLCLEALEPLAVDWRYAVNMAGSELQLLTNRELVLFLRQARNQGQGQLTHICIAKIIRSENSVISHTPLGFVAIAAVL